MSKIPDDEVKLVLTSPPYYTIKDYGTKTQIGLGQSMSEYTQSLHEVWAECVRVLHPGCKMVVNIGEQYLSAKTHGAYQVLPLHTNVIGSMQRLNMIPLGSIIWQKISNCSPSGGGSVMGSYPYPRNGIVTLDYEYVLIFKKPGTPPKIENAVKEASKMSKEDWRRNFSGHWTFPGELSKGGHPAMFPVELPRRVIQMYSFVGEKVLDPFLGSGTTLVAADQLNRQGIGYELNPEFKPLIIKRCGDYMDLSFENE